ncbi:MAG: protein kinase [Candidatus Melainabacteria bacterium]|nr:protein kinase [Candidatus Melainabacteria bacterium]
MTKFCPACHRNDVLNPHAITPERTTCPRDFFQLVEREIEDPIEEIFKGRYRTTACILPGEKHAIFKVVDVEESGDFIVSILRARSADTKRIIKFVDVWAGVKHRNVLPVTESGVSADKKFVYVISRNPGGKPLTTILDEHGTLPASTAVPIFLQLCDGLERINKVSLVHGNLMPAHIYQLEDADTANHMLISCDSVLARFVDPSPDAVASDTDVSELSPLFLGLEFMKTGEMADASTDVYSLGTAMYAMLTGLPPFSGKTFESIKVSHKEEQPLSLRGAAPGIEIPGLFDKIVLRTLKKEKIERYPNVEALRKDMIQAADQSRIYLPAQATAGYTAQPYTGDTGADKAQPTSPADFIQGNPSTAQAPPNPANTGPVDLRKELDELPPETREELEEKVKGLRSHVWVVTLVAVLVIGGVGALLMYEGPPEDRAPAWKKLSWTMAMSNGDGALNSKSFEKAKDEFSNALKIAGEIQDGGDRKVKAMEKLLIVHEGLHDKKGAETIREEIIKMDQQRLQRDEAKIK